MQKQYYAIEDNVRIRICLAEDKTELERVFGYGNVFDTMQYANDVLTERKKPSEHHLTDEERHKVEKDQLEFGWSHFTEDEKKEINAKYKTVYDYKGNAKRIPKTIDDYQREFALMMKSRETAIA